jgi:membrane fusion protein (multidrug efflux system)
VGAAKTAAQAVDAAQAGVEVARQNINQAKGQLAEARYRLTEVTTNAPRAVLASRADVAQRQAALASSTAQLDQARLNLSYTKILAPVSGIVDERSAEVGQSVAPGEQLMVVSQIDDIWITANFKETQLKSIRPGQSVTVHVDTFDKDFAGYVESMPGATGAKTSLLLAENATGNYVKVVQRLPVRIRLKPGEDPSHELRPGMSVEPKVWIK